MVMDGACIVDVAVAHTDEKGVRHGVFLLTCVAVVDVKHFARHHAVNAAHGIEECADDFTKDSLTTPFCVVEKDVGHTVGHFTDGCAADTSGEQIIVGGTVGLAEEFPSERTCEWVKEGHAIGESVLACSIVEHATVVRVGKLVAREAVAVPYPATCDVPFDDMTTDPCPFSMLHVIVPSEHEGVDAEVFDKCLESGCFGRAVWLFPEEVERTSVWSECVSALQMCTCTRDGVIPYRIRECCRIGMTDDGEKSDKSEVDTA